MSSRRTIRYLALTTLIVGLALLAFFYRDRNRNEHRDSVPDPRIVTDSPFRNIRPDVEYVGDKACAACHATIDGTFHQHPMGQSASLISADSQSQNFRFKTAGKNEFVGIHENVSVKHTEVIHTPGLSLQTEANVIATIGSGTRGKSYLCDRSGSLWQSGASWFSGQTGWDASPAFWAGRHARRAIIPECLFCHVNRVEPIEGSVNRYREPFFGEHLSIGCERCHGPGAIHVAERANDSKKDGRVDYTIVNPKHLAADLREDICRQCHLQGEVRLPRRGREAFDFRPGLPLGDFVSIYLPHPQTTDYSKSVGQVEQMSISKCASKQSCTSCHDPHSVPEQSKKDDYYRNKCNACHQNNNGCSLDEPTRRKQNNSCVACHMPRGSSSSIVHASVTDHRVMKKPISAKPPLSSPPPGELPLVKLGGSSHWPEDPESRRDLAIAVSLQSKNTPSLLRETADQLKEATVRHRGDVEAWEALSGIRYLQKDYSAAFAAIESAITLRPDREKALAKGAEMALLAGKPQKGEEYARKALSLNPGHPDYRMLIAESLIDQAKYSDAENEVLNLLKLTSNHAKARSVLAVSLYKQNRVREAMVELERAVAIYPQDSRDLRTWFSSKTK